MRQSCRHVKDTNASHECQSEVIRKRCALLPVLDDRSSDEILDYDDRGVPR